MVPKARLPSKLPGARHEKPGKYEASRLCGASQAPRAVGKRRRITVRSGSDSIQKPQPPSFLASNRPGMLWPKSKRPGSIGNTPVPFRGALLPFKLVKGRLKLSPLPPRYFTGKKYRFCKWELCFLGAKLGSKIHPTSIRRPSQKLSYFWLVLGIPLKEYFSLRKILSSSSS